MYAAIYPSWLRFAGLLFCGWLLLGTVPVRAQTGLEIATTSVTYRFGESITFRTRLRSEKPLERVLLLIRPEGQYETQIETIPVNRFGWTTFTFEPQGLQFPPFATVHYWYQTIEAAGGSESVSNSFEYIDNRFSWHSAGSGSMEVYWYEGDNAMAQKILDTGRRSWDALDGLFGASETEQSDHAVRIYVYANAQDLQSALAYGGPDWVAGHADPEFRVVMLSLPQGPERNLEIERQLPHELAHIRVYDRVSLGYYSVPVWLHEGLASLQEGFPNPSYPVVLDSAFSSETLIPLAELCSRFPTRASQAILAYAQAESFTRFIFAEYGNSGLRALLDQYADGKSCERGAEIALGKPLSQLERDWRTTAFAENVYTDLAPWLAMTGVILMPLLLVSLLGRRRPQPQEPGKTAAPGPLTPD